jgi:hypothetical protein
VDCGLFARLIRDARGFETTLVNLHDAIPVAGEKEVLLQRSECAFIVRIGEEALALTVEQRRHKLSCGPGW